MVQKHYHYVGPREILKYLSRQSGRVMVRTAEDIRRWVHETQQTTEYDDLFIATFVIDLEGRLWINDRRSEHVLCAAGRSVLSAGEMAFDVDEKSVAIVEISNQSTGYCPEPTSWSAVAQALKTTNVAHPDGWTLTCLFRLCDACGSKNLVKDGWFMCGVCDAPLSKTWNFDNIKANY